MQTRILFNAQCPICNAEICHYRSYADRRGILMEFDDLNQTDLSFYGVDQETAARRLHVFHEGKVISGVSAFEVIWAQLPRYRWLARMVCLPIIHPIGTLLYDHILAPILYAMHLRRQRKKRGWFNL